MIVPQWRVTAAEVVDHESGGAVAAEPPTQLPGDFAHMLRSGALYAGHYKCGSPAWLLLHVEEVTESTVNAVFHFVYPSSGQYGAFELSGSFSAKEGRLLRLNPGEWVHRAPGKVLQIGLAGIVSADGSRIKGEVMHMGCGGFDLNRTSDDLEPGTWRFGEMEVGGTAVPGMDVEMSAEGAVADSKASRGPLQMLVGGVAQLVDDVKRARAQAAGSSGNGGAAGASATGDATAAAANEADLSAAAAAARGLFPVDVGAEAAVADGGGAVGAQQRVLRRGLVQAR